MNKTEQEIWKRCLTNFQSRAVVSRHGGLSYLTVKFKGKFFCDSPVYHYFYGYKKYIHRRDIDGWIDPYLGFPGTEDDNDPRFPKINYVRDDSANRGYKLLKKFHNKIQNKLKPCKRLPSKSLKLFRKHLPVPEELILMICNNLLLVELEWLEKLLLEEE